MDNKFRMYLRSSFSITRPLSRYLPFFLSSMNRGLVRCAFISKRDKRVTEILIFAWNIKLLLPVLFMRKLSWFYWQLSRFHSYSESLALYQTIKLQNEIIWLLALVVMLEILYVFCILKNWIVLRLKFLQFQRICNENVAVLINGSKGIIFEK